jgi:NAD(P)H-flavin reductase
MRFLIRHDTSGEVSNYLHRLPLGSSIDVRGPNVEWDIPDDIENVVFVAGGTGIAPALQVVNALLGVEKGGEGVGRKVHILWANRRNEDCLGGRSDTVEEKRSRWHGMFGVFASKPAAPAAAPAQPSTIVKDLELLKSRYPQSLTVDYFVDEEKSFIDNIVVQKALAKVHTSTSGKNVLLVSGPEGFVKYMAGPKVWKNGREVQGELGGIASRLPQLQKGEWMCWKL